MPVAARLSLARDGNVRIQLEVIIDGENGLNAAIRLKPHPILLDINLPGIDG